MGVTEARVGGAFRIHSILNRKQAVISRKDSFAGARNDSESLAYWGRAAHVFNSSTNLPAELMVSFSRFFWRAAPLVWSIVSHKEFLVFAS